MATGESLQTGQRALSAMTMVSSNAAELVTTPCSNEQKITPTNTNADSDDAEDRKTVLKKQKKEYRDEKKRFTQELLTALHDPTIVVMADWLKVRGTLRKWNRYFCVLKPGLMLIYKSNKTEKHGYWVGTILLSSCELIERPSKKDGFCFKLFHPMDLSIWAIRGPLGESHGAVTLQPLPTTYLICRAQSEQAGGCWMDALQLTLRCSGLLMRTMHKLSDTVQKEDDTIEGKLTKLSKSSNESSDSSSVNELEAEKHFDGIDDDIYRMASDSDTGTLDIVEESVYQPSETEQLALNGQVQTEDLADENKSLVWSILKQVRPGMDLSKVILPTFILEPRSFLEKLTDFYYHADIIIEAAKLDDPLERMKAIVKFYLSGFYKKPKGLKKPYNPILGETFRCKWRHLDGSYTYYIAEQVSHHPPISAIFLTNRKGGFNISSTILAKSKYYGNSLSAMMIGDVRITLLSRGETYIATLPYANCKGIMIGTLSMEYAGQVRIECNRSNYTCSINFKLKPFIGGVMNIVTGDIKDGKDIIANIDGHWDDEIFIAEKGVRTALWAPTKDVIMQRLKRFEIPIEEQSEWESKKLWLKVSESLFIEDQKAATEEKTKLENVQRERAKTCLHHKPKWFKLDPITRNYEYIYADYQPWDASDDVRQIEHNYVIKTLTKHGTKSGSQSLSSTSAAQEQSDESDAVESAKSKNAFESKRHRLKKRFNSTFEIDRLQQIQDSLDKSIEFMRRLEISVNERSNVNSAFQQICISVIVFALFQYLIFPLLIGPKG